MRSLPEGEDGSGINGAFLKTNYGVNQEASTTAAKCQIKLKWLIKINYWITS